MILLDLLQRTPRGAFQEPWHLKMCTQHSPRWWRFVFSFFHTQGLVNQLSYSITMRQKRQNLFRFVPNLSKCVQKISSLSNSPRWWRFVFSFFHTKGLLNQQSSMYATAISYVAKWQILFWLINTMHSKDLKINHKQVTGKF